MMATNEEEIYPTIEMLNIFLNHIKCEEKKENANIPKLNALIRGMNNALQGLYEVVYPTGRISYQIPLIEEPDPQPARMGVQVEVEGIEAEVIEAVDVEAEEVEADEVEVEEVEAEEIEAVDVEAEEVEAVDVEAEEVEVEEFETEGIEAEEVEADEVEADEVEADEVEADEVEADEVEAEEVEVEEFETEGIEAEEVEADAVEADEVDAEEVEAEEVEPVDVEPVAVDVEPVAEAEEVDAEGIDAEGIDAEEVEADDFNAVAVKIEVEAMELESEDDESTEVATAAVAAPEVETEINTIVRSKKRARKFLKSLDVKATEYVKRHANNNEEVVEVRAGIQLNGKGQTMGKAKVVKAIKRPKKQAQKYGKVGSVKAAASTKRKANDDRKIVQLAHRDKKSANVPAMAIKLENVDNDWDELPIFSPQQIPSGSNRKKTQKMAAISYDKVAVAAQFIKQENKVQIWPHLLENVPIPHRYTCENALKDRFVCTCGKTFLKIQGLYGHMYYYNIERKFDCEHCDCCFRLLSPLIRHFKLSHNYNTELSTRSKRVVQKPERYRDTDDPDNK